MFYYRGLQEWKNEKGYLTDTCLAAQDVFKKYLDYFRIGYDRVMQKGYDEVKDGNDLSVEDAFNKIREEI